MGCLKARLVLFGQKRAIAQRQDDVLTSIDTLVYMTANHYPCVVQRAEHQCIVLCCTVGAADIDASAESFASL